MIPVDDVQATFDSFHRRVHVNARFVARHQARGSEVTTTCLVETQHVVVVMMYINNTYPFELYLHSIDHHRDHLSHTLHARSSEFCGWYAYVRTYAGHKSFF